MHYLSLVGILRHLVTRLGLRLRRLSKLFLHLWPWRTLWRQYTLLGLVNPGNLRATDASSSAESCVTSRTAASRSPANPAGPCMASDKAEILDNDDHRSERDHLDSNIQPLVSSSQHLSPVQYRVSSPESYRLSDMQASVCQPAPLSPKRIVFPIATPWIERYKRDVTIPKTESRYDVEALTTTFDLFDVAEWKPFAHPEGVLYFFHPGKRILTEANLYDNRVLAEITIFAAQIDELRQEKDAQLSQNIDLVLELIRADDGEMMCGYYFADHIARCLFWLETFDATYLLQEVKGATNPSHIRHELESQYWKHCSYFPNTRIVSQDILDELKEVIVHAAGDVLTSSIPAEVTGAFSVDTLQTLSSLVDQIEVSAVPRLGYLCVVARLMSAFAHHRFLHFHGQHGVRLSQTQTIHGEAKGGRSFLITLLSPFLFYAPDAHSNSLDLIWVDELVSHDAWGVFIETLNSEWIEFILYGTVLLNANVAFLAIPGVDNGEQGAHRSPPQLASYLSVISSIGCVIVGLLLVRQNRTKNLHTSGDAAVFLHKISVSHPVFGLEVLSIMYSLPYALLMWGMVSFLVAFALLCFAANQLTRWLIGAVGFVVCVLVLWCIATGWERGGLHWPAWPSMIWQSCRRMIRHGIGLPIRGNGSSC